MCNNNNEITAIEVVPTQIEKAHKWTPDEIETIKNTVAKGASDSELKMFLSLASAHGLNPFNHEIWFIKMGGGNVIITARDGYLKIANNNPHFQGMNSDVVYSGDKFTKNDGGVLHVYNVQNRGHIIGAYAIVYRDDRTVPAFFFAPFNDYNKRGGVWNQYPHAMILKVAEAMALKRAFSINGLVTQEELGYQGTQKIESDEQKAMKSERERGSLIRHIWNKYLAVCDNQPNHAFNAMKKITNKDKSSEYTDDDIAKLLEDVARRENELAEKASAENEATEQRPESVEPEIIESPEITD